MKLLTSGSKTGTAHMFHTCTTTWLPTLCDVWRVVKASNSSDVTPRTCTTSNRQTNHN